VVEGVGVPVNVLALRTGPSIGELADAGVRRVSTGGGLARAAYGAFVAAAEELRDSGTSEYAAQNLSSDRTDQMLTP
jgi:2-methylisocitrate lyase-like PEP mutase family enzyme